MPTSGKLYSPPIDELSVSIVRESPTADGSYVTSNTVSTPGAAATDLSAWNSEFSS